MSATDKAFSLSALLHDPINIICHPAHRFSRTFLIKSQFSFFIVPRSFADQSHFIRQRGAASSSFGFPLESFSFKRTIIPKLFDLARIRWRGSEVLRRAFARGSEILMDVLYLTDI